MGAGNVLGLLFEINADPSNAQAAIDRFKASSAASMTSFSSITSSALNAITGPTAIAIGGITALGTALFAASKKAAEMGSQIYEASEKTGISAEKLSGLRINSKLLGESFDSLTLSLGRAGKNIAEGLGDASSKAGKDLLGLLGSQKAVMEFGLMPMEDRVASLTKRIFEQTDVGERNRLLMEFFGRGALQNISTLQKLAEEGYDPAIARAKQFGQFFTGESAAQMRQYVVELESAKAQIEGLAITIGGKAAPAFTKLLGLLAGNANMAAEFRFELKLLEIGLKAQATSLFNFFGIYEKFLEEHAADAQAVEDQRVRAMTRFLADMDAFAKAVKGATGAYEGHTKAAKESTWQIEALLSAIKQFTGISRSLQVQLDSGTSPALRRYLEVEEKLAELTLKLDVSMLRRQNLTLYQKQVTEELANAHVKLTDRLQAETKFNDVLAGQIPKLTAAERARLPLIYDETNALARILQNSRAVVDEMMLGELPARQRINIQIDRQIAAADREIAKYRERAAVGQISLAQLEAAETQYTAATESLSLQRQQALEDETVSQIDATVRQAAGLLQVLGYRKAAAIVEAVWETAQGFAALATFNFWGAAQHFLAAATYAVIAGQSTKSPAFNASVSGAVIGGGGGVASAGTVAGGPAPVMGAGSVVQPKNAPPEPSVVIHIADGGALLKVDGDYLALPQAQDKLLGYLNQAVNTRDAILVSSHSKRPPPAGR